MVKNLPANVGDLRYLGSIPGLGRSPGEGIATHSSILVWRIPCSEDPGRLQTLGSQELDMTEMTFCYCRSVAHSCSTLCNLMDCSTPGFPVFHHLLEPAQNHVHQVGDAIQPSCPLSSLSPAFNLSQHQGLFQGVSASHQVAKYWSFSISPSNEYPGLISFRIDWLGLFAVRGTLKNLLQHHSSKA